MEILFIIIFMFIFAIGFKLFIYSAKEKIAAKHYANAQKEILEKEAELEELRNYRINSNDDYNDYDN